MLIEFLSSLVTVIINQDELVSMFGEAVGVGVSRSVRAVFVPKMYI